MNIRTFGKVLWNSLASDIEYRSNYLILMFSNLVTIAMELALFTQIYGDRATVAGLDRAMIPSFIVLGIVIRTTYVVWSLVMDAIEQIRDGSFRRFILQPLHFPSYFYAQALGPKLPTWALNALTILVLKCFPAFHSLLPLATVAPFLLAMALASFLVWQMYLTIVYLAFWVEEANFLGMAFNLGVGAFSGSLIPLNWLPPGLVNFLRLTPFPLIGDFPMRTALALITPDEFWGRATATVVWSAFFVVLNIGLKRRGLAAYEAFGG